MATPAPSSKQQKKSATRSSLGILGTQLLMYPIAFGVSVLVARVLGASDRGIYAFLLTLEGFLLPMLFFGMNSGIVYHVSRGTYHPKQASLAVIASGLFHGLLNSVLIWVLWQNQWLGETGRALTPELLWPFLLIMPIDGMYFALYHMVRGHSDFGIMNVMDLLKTLLTPLLLFVFVILGAGTLQEAVYAIVVGKVTLSLVLLGTVIWRYRPSLFFAHHFLRATYTYGIRAWPGAISNYANARFDHLLLGITAAPGLLGNYSIAARLTSVLRTPADAVAPVLLNRVAALKDTEASAELTEQIHRLLFLLVSLIAIGVGAISWWLIPFLFGPEFSDAVLPFIILLPGMIAMSVTRRCLDKFLSGNGKPGQASIIHFSGALVGVGGYLLLIAPFGLVGAAIASTLGDITAMIVAMWFYIRAVQPRKPQLFILRRADLVWMWKRLMQVWEGTRKQLRTLP